MNKKILLGIVVIFMFIGTPLTTARDLWGGQYVVYTEAHPFAHTIFDGEPSIVNGVGGFMDVNGVVPGGNVGDAYVVICRGDPNLDREIYQYHGTVTLYRVLLNTNVLDADGDGNPCKDGTICVFETCHDDLADDRCDVEDVAGIYNPKHYVPREFKKVREYGPCNYASVKGGIYTLNSFYVDDNGIDNGYYHSYSFLYKGTRYTVSPDDGVIHWDWNDPPGQKGVLKDPSGGAPIEAIETGNNGLEKGETIAYDEKHDVWWGSKYPGVAFGSKTLQMWDSSRNRWVNGFFHSSQRASDKIQGLAVVLEKLIVMDQSSESMFVYDIENDGSIVPGLGNPDRYTYSYTRRPGVVVHPGNMGAGPFGHLWVARNNAFLELGAGGLCGDGLIDGLYGEECDLGDPLDPSDDQNPCRARGLICNVANPPREPGDPRLCTCVPDKCGDGTNSITGGLDPGEECDLGDLIDPLDDIACVDPTQTCNMVLPVLPTDPARCSCYLPCGNGILDPSEECEDGNTIDGDGCSATCTLECGDGFKDITPPYVEECDDGNTIDGDGCSSSCVDECGNGVIDGTEECDDGNTIDEDTCVDDCKNAYCGDGHIQSLPMVVETCDDGNTVNGDGCDEFCQIEGGLYDGEFVGRAPFRGTIHTFNVAFTDKSIVDPVNWEFNITGGNSGCTATFTDQDPLPYSKLITMGTVGEHILQLSMNINQDSICIVQFGAIPEGDSSYLKTKGGTYILYDIQPLCPECGVVSIPDVTQPITIYSGDSREASDWITLADSAISALDTRCGGPTCGGNNVVAIKLSEAKNHRDAAKAINPCPSTSVCQLSQYYSARARKLAAEGIELLG